MLSRRGAAELYWPSHLSANLPEEDQIYPQLDEPIYTNQEIQVGRPVSPANMLGTWPPPVALLTMHDGVAAAHGGA